MGTPEQRVVVGIDGSPGARLALGWAMAEAARRRAALEVVSAFPVDFAWADPYLLDPRQIDDRSRRHRERAWALVHESARACRTPVRRGPGGATCRLAGAAAAHLVRRAEDADLLVVGSRGRGGVRSTVRGIGRPALRRTRRVPGGGRPSRNPPFTEPARWSSASTTPTTAGRRWPPPSPRPPLLGARVEAVIGHEAPNYWSDLYAVMLPPVGETAEHAQRARGDDGPRGARARSRADGVSVVAVEGHPAQVADAPAEGARLLVLGSRSRNQLEAVALGSVALSAVMHAPCPVLVVHPPRTAQPDRARETAATVG